MDKTVLWTSGRFWLMSTEHHRTSKVVSRPAWFWLINVISGCPKRYFWKGSSCHEIFAGISRRCPKSLREKESLCSILVVPYYRALTPGDAPRISIGSVELEGTQKPTNINNFLRLSRERVGSNSFVCYVLLGEKRETLRDPEILLSQKVGFGPLFGVGGIPILSSLTRFFWATRWRASMILSKQGRWQRVSTGWRERTNKRSMWLRLFMFLAPNEMCFLSEVAKKSVSARPGPSLEGTLGTRMGPGRAGMAPTSGPGWVRNAVKQSTWRIWTGPLDPGEGLDGTPRDSSRRLALYDQQCAN